MNSISDIANNSQRKRKFAPTLPENFAGKLPPQAPELEEAVLGAIMIEKDALTQVMDVLTTEAFYKDSHQIIYKAILHLSNHSEPIDILTVSQHLKKTGELEIVGGAYYIAQLTSKVGSAAHIEYHARIISQKFIQRELIKISGETLRDAFEDSTDAFDLLGHVEQTLFDLSNQNIKKNYETIQDLIVKAREKIATAAQSDTGLTGVPSGFTALDRITGGWQPSTMNVIAARPGHGKTAFALTIARNAAVEFKRPVAFFSLEMDSLSLVMRLISAEVEVNSNNLTRGQLLSEEWKRLEAKITGLLDAPIYIDDTPGISITEFRAKARRLKKEKNIEMIVIDYIQLMTVGGGDDNRMVREQVISTISRNIKGISKELGIPIMALAQVGRVVEKRGGTEPMLSDLRESGAIEQDADMVMFLHRPEMLGIPDVEGVSTKGLAQVVIKKHRNGSLETIDTKFISEFTKFVEMDSFNSKQYGETSYADNNYSQNSSLKPNTGFDEGDGTKTFKSKNWDNASEDEHGFNSPTNNEDAPF